MMKYGFVILGLALLTACQQQDSHVMAQDEPAPVTKSSQNRGDVIAQINGQDITIDELDEPLVLTLHDLDMQAYKLRKDALNQMVQMSKDNHSASGNTEPFSARLFLEPPFPPRLSLPEDNRLIKGDVNAPIRVRVFCSYQSSHCVRLQPVLEQIEQAYLTQVNFGYYDFPQNFHRHGRPAANAVRCASMEQDPWDFQSSIYGAFDDLGIDRYILIGRQLGLTSSSFEVCLERGTYADAVDRDVRLSQTMGFSSVPIVLINGLYMRGPQSLEAYTYYIDHELNRLGVKKEMGSKMKKSRLPLRVQGIFLGTSNENSRVIIEFTETEKVGSFYETDEITSDVMLTEIRKDRIIVDNSGVREYILLQGNSVNSRDAKIDDGLIPDDHRRAVRVRDQSANTTLANKSTVVLSRDWVSHQLLDQEVLNAHFKPSSHKVEGFNLMKLDDVSQSEFYRTLGLKPGDAVVQVNDDWINSDQNPLWNAMGQTNEFSLTILRRGRSVKYYYGIKD